MFGPEGNTIVLQPGSLYLRVGLASDAAPIKSLHCIARLRKQGGGIYNELTARGDAGQDWTSRQQQALTGLYQGLRNSGREDVSGGGDTIKLNIKQQQNQEPSLPEMLIGDEILEKDTAGYNLHFPIKGSELNVHSGIGGSLTSILQDLTSIWGAAISRALSIQPDSFKEYQVILLVPALYSRSDVKHMMSVLLDTLGFKAAFPLQEDVAATFGSGVSTACVVDVGHHKISVSCVEDAISLTRTRLCLTYGGSLITNLFRKLTQDEGLPCEVDPSSLQDTLLINNIKECVCSLRHESMAPNSVHSVSAHKFRLAASATPAGMSGTPSEVTFQLQSRLPAIIAPMGFFQLELCDYMGPYYLRTMRGDEGDPCDPHDAAYLQDTSRRYIKTGDIIQGEDQDEQDDPQFNQGGVGGGGAVDQTSDQNSVTASKKQPAVTLDQALLRSVSTITSEDLQRRLLMNVLVVGGGSELIGLRHYLQARLNTLVVGGVEVVTAAGGRDLEAVSWKGGAVLAGMETAQELWIQRGEWKKSGVKILRERSIFSWS